MEERTNSPAARLYRSMYLIRRVEEEIVRLYPTDKIKSPVHLSIGQEAVSAARVRPSASTSDVVFGTYRGHALYLAKGGDVPRMMAELYGKVDGCAARQGGLDAPGRSVGRHDGHVGGGRRPAISKRSALRWRSRCRSRRRSSSASSARARPTRAPGTRA